MTNSMDDENGLYFVVTNDEGQHAIWPSHVTLPSGWQVRLGESDRRTCLAYVNARWTDLRPRSLAEAMDRAGPA